jgi:hypothetical protein
MGALNGGRPCAGVAEETPASLSPERARRGAFHVHILHQKGAILSASWFRCIYLELRNTLALSMLLSKIAWEAP